MSGKPPSPRTYHTSSAMIGDKLYVFSGGEAGAAPVSDPKLHVFDTGWCSTRNTPKLKNGNAHVAHLAIFWGDFINLMFYHEPCRFWVVSSWLNALIVSRFG